MNLDEAQSLPRELDTEQERLDNEDTDPDIILVVELELEPHGNEPKGAA